MSTIVRLHNGYHHRQVMNTNGATSYDSSVGLRAKKDEKHNLGNKSCKSIGNLDFHLFHPSSSLGMHQWRCEEHMQDADRLEFICQDFQLLGTCGECRYILVMNGRVAPLVLIADTGKPCEGNCRLNQVTCMQLQVFWTPWLCVC